ncbi:MAG: hypothetical protein ABSC63_10615 [Candidatus Binataceae bacterium]|jgi:hypothetical protein
MKSYRISFSPNDQTALELCTRTLGTHVLPTREFTPDGGSLECILIVGEWEGEIARGNPLKPIGHRFAERHLEGLLKMLTSKGAAVKAAPRGFYNCPIAGVDFFILSDGGAASVYDDNVSTRPHTA